MKPSKMRNRQFHKATKTQKSRQISAALSKDLRSQYARRGARVVVGDSVKIVRGEFTDITGKVNKVITKSGRVVVEGLQKEMTKGGKLDLTVHASNLVITSLNTDDKWRQKILKRGKQGIVFEPIMEKPEIVLRKLSEAGQDGPAAGGPANDEPEHGRVSEAGQDGPAAGGPANDEPEHGRVSEAGQDAPADSQEQESGEGSYSEHEVKADELQSDKDSQPEDRKEGA